MMELVWVPYVSKDGVVTIFIGEEFRFTGDEKDGKLINLRYVEGEAKGPVVTLKLQTEGGITTLELGNGFGRDLKYRAWHWYSDVGGEERTCPVLAGKVASMRWEDSLANTTVTMHDFRFFAEGEPRVCAWPEENSDP